jgi:hypothetical protein
MMNEPALLSLFSLVLMWLAAELGSFWNGRRTLRDDEREHFGVVQTVTLTLLGLIIGFSFSMAMTRYDQRKNYEEAEANAIGTEFVRAGLLPAADQAAVQQQLRRYLDLRIRFYRNRDASQLPEINAATGRLQSEMWAAVREPAVARPTAVITLAVAGMNDVLNSQGYTQAAWWNRIPVAAWIFMVLIALCSNLLIGYGARKADARFGLLLVLPLIVSIAFLLIADIDSPGRGLIRIVPQNLVSLAQSLPR